MPFWSYFRRLFGHAPRFSESLRLQLHSLLSEGWHILRACGDEGDVVKISESEMMDAKQWAIQVESTLLKALGQLGPLFVYKFRGQTTLPVALRPLEQPESPDHACEFFGLGDRMALRYGLQVRVTNLEKLLQGTL